MICNVKINKANLDARCRRMEFQVQIQKKKYPTNFNVYRLRNDLMQFNNNQECEFNTNLLCMLLLLSPPTPFYCKNCRTFLFTNISLQTYHPLLLGLPAPGSKKILADIVKFIFNLKNVKFGEIANILFLKSLEYMCPFNLSY